MGFNSAVVVMNDHLSSIEKDKNFGKNLVNAILEASIARPVEVHSGNSIGSARVVSVSDSYGMIPILIGHNMGVPLGTSLAWDDTVEEMEMELLQKLAMKHGYTIRKRAAR